MMFGGSCGHARRAPHAGAIEAHDPMRARRAQDPFAMMDGMMESMMMEPFGRRGGGLFGDPFGDPSARMGGRPSMDTMGGRMGGCSSSLMMSANGGGHGAYTSHTMVFSSQVGADGKAHTEQFSSSSVGNHGRGLRETQQAYSNSRTGMDKMSMERIDNDRGQKTVRERHRFTGDETSTDMFRGITEEEAPAFHQHWERNAAPQLPSHNRHRSAMIEHAPHQHRGHSTPARQHSSRTARHGAFRDR
eukprot:NODE_13619_length_1156_cov_5.417881.p1 GENE.NODE_13619_length_1156_cov_5.417881~~NODE_13619_length_1156_cov_5.417881.p1  ORF type:complete len:246 (+),score=48.98 NODE_13619_length_1156_cov_5.417881:164-901(+)